MRKTIFLAGIAAAVSLAACGNDVDNEFSDTAMVPGIDTSAGFAVPPTTDTLMTMPADTLMPTDTLTDTTDTTTTP